MSDWSTVAAALGGAVVGALASGGVALRLESVRFNREASSRWLRDLREISARLLDTSDAAASSARDLERKLKRGENVDALWADELGPKAAVVRLSVTEIELLGTEEEIQAARDLREAIAELVTGNDLGDSFEDREQAFLTARSGFVTACRSRLGASKG